MINVENCKANQVFLTEFEKTNLCDLQKAVIRLNKNWLVLENFSGSQQSVVGLIERPAEILQQLKN